MTAAQEAELRPAEPPGQRGGALALTPEELARNAGVTVRLSNGVIGGSWVNSTEYNVLKSWRVLPRTDFRFVFARRRQWVFPRYLPRLYRHRILQVLFFRFLQHSVDSVQKI